MAEEENRHLRREIQRLQDYIENQRKRHTDDIKSLRDDLREETKYSKKLREKLEEEYKHCDRLRKDLASKTQLTKDLRDDLDDERNYSEKLERKLEKRDKIIKELEADLLDLEDDYAEARSALKRMDQLRRDLEEAKIQRLYSKQRVQQLQDEVHSLRSTSRSASPSQSPAFTTTALRYAPSVTSPPTQVHVLSNTSHLRIPTASPSRAPSPLRRAVTPPPRAPSATPELESDYSEEEEDDETGRLTEEEEVREEVAEAEAEEAELSAEAHDGRRPGSNEADQVDDAPGQELRRLAVREGRLADREYERAREAYASGDKAFAKKLQETGAQHRNNMRNYNRAAAAEIFNHHNPEYHSNPNSRVKIDLHHLHVREAEEFVRTHIENCRRAGLQCTEIISGRGNHSTGGVARIRPAILALLDGQPDLEVDQHDPNPGRITVRFTDNSRSEDTGARSRRGMRSGPEHAEYDDVFEQGRTRLKAATRAAEEVRNNIEEIEHGMRTLRMKSPSRLGLRAATMHS
ncbi:uncharacterized protein FOMMEDRAFT_164311 [Fomitiporia mediterranea MF3/22]|uniref:uncharacterized protein n=1 Tax=Fomitiporia mediterranea (strain MF3/22) TaxID=694068 RepID=UPI0004407A32|nr:uncharacterized protein FOMMEDRAFT_164311 [Fomitiporia mediterranea MF3/22]EJD07308.1 hypothetical protein FOMMEDRAFT_164311 [Fomitiporia mediterranea MF3/22]